MKVCFKGQSPKLESFSKQTRESSRAGPRLGFPAARGPHHRSPTWAPRGSVRPKRDLASPRPPLLDTPASPHILCASLSFPAPLPAGPGLSGRGQLLAPQAAGQGLVAPHGSPEPNSLFFLSFGPYFSPKHLPPQTLQSLAPEPLSPFSPQESTPHRHFAPLPGARLLSAIHSAQQDTFLPPRAPLPPAPALRPTGPLPPYLAPIFQQQPPGAHPHPPQAPAPATGAVSCDEEAGLPHRLLDPGGGQHRARPRPRLRLPLCILSASISKQQTEAITTRSRSLRMQAPLARPRPGSRSTAPAQETAAALGQRG